MKNKSSFRSANSKQKKCKSRKRGVQAMESLTNREKQVLELVLHGRKTREIRKDLNIANSTLRTYYKHIYQKLFVSSKQELIQKYKN
jgi:DNA-binding NarL/FixJ family response regulator